MKQIWTHPGWAPIRTLAGHESKVMAVDISAGISFPHKGAIVIYIVQQINNTLLQHLMIELLNYGPVKKHDCMSCNTCIPK